jgi:hypothetical protein
MDPSSEEYLGRVAYEGYRTASGGASLVGGQDLPGWDWLRDEVRSAWCAAAGAVQRELPGDPADEPKELRFSDEEGEHPCT